MTIDRKLFSMLFIYFCILAVAGCAASPEKQTTNKTNNALANSETMLKNFPIHVHLFSIAEADLD